MKDILKRSRLPALTAAAGVPWADDSARCRYKTRRPAFNKNKAIMCVSLQEKCLLMIHFPTS
jgi:hypothetical protein